MNSKTKLSLAVGLSLTASSSFAALEVADSRTNAMGNAGVAAADYLAAPFYNPALAAYAREEDDFGLLLPAIAGTVYDTDDSLSDLDDLVDVIEEYEDGGSSDPALLNQINGYLDSLDGNAPLSVVGNAGMAIAIPNDTVSVNLFYRGYVEVSVSTDITADDYTDSSVDIDAFGYTEYGVTLAKEFDLSGEMLSFGITPKYQRMRTYSQQNLNIEDFDIDDYEESEVNESAFNFDLGFSWRKDSWTVALAAKDLISQEIELDDSTKEYELGPQVTLGAAYRSRFFTGTLDYDFTKQTRFTDVDDDTRYLRFGVEGNAWDWAQLRAGYQIDMENTIDDMVTAGIGISPFDVVNIDIAGSYAGDNQFGASMNLAFTF